MPGPFVNIEDKQDSAEQLAATQGIPSQFKYSAVEWNLLRDKIEQLHSILQGEIDLVATTIKNEFRLVDLSGTNANQYILSRVIHWLNNLEGEDKIVLKPNVVFTLEAYYAVGSYVIKESWQIKQEGNLEDKTFGVGEAPAPLSILLPIEKTIKLINQGNTVSLGEIGNPPNDQNGNPISAEEHISNEVNILLPNEPARQGFVFNALFNGLSRNFYFNGPNAAYGLNGSQTSSNQFYEFKETTNEEDVENVIEKTSQLINDGEDGASRFIEENELEDLETDPTVPQYIKDLTSENIENFATAFQENIINVVVTGDQNKQLTLTKRDGSTIVATFTDNQGEVVDNVVNSIDFNEANGVLSIQTEEGNTLTTSFDGRYALWSHNHEINEVNDLQNKLNNKLSYGDKGIFDNNMLTEPNILGSQNTTVDLDTLKNGGWFRQRLANNPNSPYVNGVNYYLFVISYGDGGNVTQITYPYFTNAANIKIRNTINGNWQSWEELPYTSDLQTSLDKANNSIQYGDKGTYTNSANIIPFHAGVSTNVPTGTAFSDLQEVGYYGLVVNAPDRPSAVSNSFFLQNYKYTTRLTQIATTYGASKVQIFIRNQISASGFTEWQRYAMADEVATAEQGVLADNSVQYGDKGILDNSSLLTPNLPTEVEIVDLDTITNEGWYPKLIASDSNNNPQNIQGYLLVGGFGSSSSQIFYPYRKDQGKIAYRTKLSGIWSDWGILPYQDEVDNRVKKTGDKMTGPLEVSVATGENADIFLNEIDGQFGTILRYNGANNTFELIGIANGNEIVGLSQTRTPLNNSLKYLGGQVYHEGNLDITQFAQADNSVQLTNDQDINGKKSFFDFVFFKNNASPNFLRLSGGQTASTIKYLNSSNLGLGGVSSENDSSLPEQIFLKGNGMVGINNGNPQEQLDINGNAKADKFITTDGNYTVETFKGDRNIGASPIIKGGIEIQGTFESVLTRLLMGIEENGEAYFKSNNHFTIEGKLLAQLLTEDFQLKITSSGYTFKEVGVGGHTVFKLDPERFINIAEVTLPKNSGQLMALAPNAITSDNVPNVTYNQETGLLKEIDRPVSTFINTSNTGFSARNITYNVVNGRLILIGGATASADAVEVELLTLPTNARPDATRIVTNIFYELTINTNGVVTLANVADGQSYNIDFEITLNFL